MKNTQITKKLVSSILKKRKPFSHKGDYGHALLVTGSYGKIGASILSASACLKSGVGLLTVHIPKCGYIILQTTVPEAMVIADEYDKIITSKISLEKYKTIGIGPGIGTHKASAAVLKNILQSFSKPIIIDADAINILSDNKKWLTKITPQSIFTPHEKEFERLVGSFATDKVKTELQIKFSVEHKVFVILKGHQTQISCPDGTMYINTSGNAGMAKGGSGDSLTGILTALLTQGYSSLDTCIIGVYIHGLAGDIAVKKTSEFALLPSDLIAHLGEAFLETMQSK